MLFDNYTELLTAINQKASKWHFLAICSTLLSPGCIFKVKPNENWSEYIVYKNLAATWGLYMAKNRPKMAQKRQKQHFFQKYRCFLKISRLSFSIKSELGQIYSLWALDTDNKPKLAWKGKNLHFN